MVFAQINSGQLQEANINLIFQFCSENSSKFEIKEKTHN
jgi:hypothetical protein